MIVLRKWSRLRRLSNVIGLSIMVLALILASFAQSAWQLILTQGILYGIGGAMSWCPCILYLHEWFIRRAGLALGVMWVRIPFELIARGFQFDRGTGGRRLRWLNGPFHRGLGIENVWI